MRTASHALDDSYVQYAVAAVQYAYRTVRMAHTQSKHVTNHRHFARLCGE